MKQIICAWLFFVPFFAKSQDVNWETKEWANDVKTILASFMSCGGPTAANTPCNVFLGQALSRVYGIDDFKITGGGYMSANDIAGYVENDSKWTVLGAGNDANALKQAQGYANLGKAVVAVEYVQSGHGHVCMIIPGNLVFSPKWNLNCPNSASLFLGKPNSSYVGKSLAFAFSQPAQVKIYGRN